VLFVLLIPASVLLPNLLEEEVPTEVSVLRAADLSMSFMLMK